MNYSKGICWIDDCRIPFVDEGDMNNTLEAKYTIGEDKQSDMGFGTKKIGNVSKPEGRFPANLLCCDDVLNDGSITNKGKMKLHRMSGWGDKINKDAVEYQGDKGSNSRYYDIDIWFNNLLNNI